jgi:hypothetical protein
MQDIQDVPLPPYLELKRAMHVLFESIQPDGSPWALGQEGKTRRLSPRLNTLRIDIPVSITVRTIWEGARAP